MMKPFSASLGILTRLRAPGVHEQEDRLPDDPLAS
jgi:hypothetical protein